MYNKGPSMNYLVSVGRRRGQKYLISLGKNTKKWGRGSKIGDFEMT